MLLQDQLPPVQAITKIRLYIFMVPMVPSSTEPTFLAPANPLALMKNGIIPPRFITPL